LPASTSAAALSLQPIALTPPSGEKIGGISFDATSSTVYVPFQKATGGKNKDDDKDKKKPGGSIYSYAVAQQSQATLPVFSSATELVSSLPDTPEFVLYWSEGS
jgi:hypothetical protein